MPRGPLTLTLANDKQNIPCCAITILAGVEAGSVQRTTACSDAVTDTYTHLSNDPVAAPVFTVPSGIFSERKLVKHDWEASLKNFRVGDPRVRHMRMDPAAAVPVRACSRATGDSLIVAHLLISKCQIVHASLRVFGLEKLSILMQYPVISQILQLLRFKMSKHRKTHNTTGTKQRVKAMTRGSAESASVALRRLLCCYREGFQMGKIA